MRKCILAATLCVIMWSVADSLAYANTAVLSDVRETEAIHLTRALTDALFGAYHITVTDDEIETRFGNLWEHVAKYGCMYTIEWRECAGLLIDQQETLSAKIEELKASGLLDKLRLSEDMLDATPIIHDGFEYHLSIDGISYMCYDDNCERKKYALFFEVVDTLIGMAPGEIVLLDGIWG